VQCAGASFICWECDERGEISFGTHDFHTHDLVRVQEFVEEKDLSVEEQLTELEKNILERVEATVDARIAKVEQLLEQLLNKLGVA
jgi:hypothetical protein